VMVGLASTVIVSTCWSGVPMPFAACTVTMKTPYTEAVPDSVPSVASDRPVGSDPLTTEKDGAGYPVAVTENVPATPSVKVHALALVIAGWSVTIREKFCVASGVTPLAAFTTKV